MNPTFEKMVTILGNPIPWDLKKDLTIAKISYSYQKKFYFSNYGTVFLCFRQAPGKYAVTRHYDWILLNKKEIQNIPIYEYENTLILENFFVPFEYQNRMELFILNDIILTFSASNFTTIVLNNCNKYMQNILDNLGFIREGDEGNNFYFTKVSYR